jgi:hypothetical protein
MFLHQCDGGARVSARKKIVGAKKNLKKKKWK